MSHISISHVTHISMNHVAHTSMSHVTCMKQSCHTWVSTSHVTHIWKSHVTHMKQSSHTRKFVTLQTASQGQAWTCLQRVTYKRVMFHFHSHVPHMTQWYVCDMTPSYVWHDTYKGVLFHIWSSQVTHIGSLLFKRLPRGKLGPVCSVSHIKESCFTHDAVLS